MAHIHGSGISNKFLRVRPQTTSGAPARGSTVRLHHQGGRKQLQVIDSGSGYLCQQEPVAHFGLGDGTGGMTPVRVVVRWGDGAIVVIRNPPMDCVLTLSKPTAGMQSVPIARECVGDVDGVPVVGMVGRVDLSLGSIRASVCPSDTNTAVDNTITIPPRDGPTQAIISRAQQRTEDLRKSQVLEVWGGNTVDALHDEYYDIFPKSNNRNAASHLWSSFVLRRSLQLKPSQIRELMSGFCSVSGSPVRPVSE